MLFSDASALHCSSHSALMFFSLSTSLGPSPVSLQSLTRNRKRPKTTASPRVRTGLSLLSQRVGESSQRILLIARCLCSAVKYVGGYHGLLSGVTVRPGSVEPHSVVECLYACREGLDFGDLETLGSGMKVKKGRKHTALVLK